MANWWESAPLASPLDIGLHQEGISGPLADLARSVYQQESGGGRNTRTSNAGAVGGMQILPATFAEVADDGWDINDPIQNARAGLRYLNRMYEQGGNDPRMAAIGYYGGPGAIKAARAGQARTDPRNPQAPDTFQYADQVVARMPHTPGLVERAVNAVIPAAQAAETAPSGNWWEQAELVAPAPQAAQQNEKWWEAAPLADAQSTTAPQPVGNATGGGIMGGMLQGMRDPIDAGAQMLRRAVPDGVGESVDQFGNYLADLGLPVARSEGVKGVDAIVNQSNRQYDADRAAAGREGMDWARLGGNIAATWPIARILPTISSPALTGRMLAGGAQGAGVGLLAPVVGENAQENFWTEKGKQAGIGGVFGATAPVVIGGLSRLVSPKASLPNSPAQTLISEGVELTPGQAMGGAMMRMEDRMMSAPIVGDAIRSARTRGNESLNRAVYNRVLAPIEKTVAGSGRDAVDDAARLVSQSYDDVLGKVKFAPDSAFSQSIANIKSMAQDLPRREARALEGVLQRDVIDPLTKGNWVDGMTFKRVESQLGERSQQFLKATDAYQNDVGRALQEVQKALQENLSRMNPSHATELRNVNTAFANLVRLENAAGRIGAQEGVFTPQQLASAIRQTDRSVRSRAYAAGKALMQDLSDAAQSRMAAKIPDSGTAERLMANALTGGSLAGAVGIGALSPGIAASVLGGLGLASVPYLPGFSKAATWGLTARPEAAQNIARMLRTLPPGYFGLLAGSSQ